MARARKKTSFVPRLVFGTGVAGVVPLCVALVPASCSEAPGPVIYPAHIGDASADGDGDAEKSTLESGAAEAEPDAADDGPLGPIIYPPAP